jgi:lipoprotein NlpI
MAATARADGLDFARQAQQAESRRDFEQATVLYTKAIEAGDLQPDQLVDALRYRGNANFFLGRFSKAAEDYVRSLKRNPKDLYAALWLFLAREFAGQDGQPELIRIAKQIDLFYWPGPVANLYLGQASTDEILEAAKDPFLDGTGQKEQSCEAYFYAGQFALLNGDKASAIHLFRSAVATGVTTFIEYDAARLSLERLGG